MTPPATVFPTDEWEQTSGREIKQGQSYNREASGTLHSSITQVPHRNQRL